MIHCEPSPSTWKSSCFLFCLFDFWRVVPFLSISIFFVAFSSSVASPWMSKSLFGEIRSNWSELIQKKFFFSSFRLIRRMPRGCSEQRQVACCLKFPRLRSAVYVRVVFTFHFERFLFIISTLVAMILFDSDKQNVFLLLLYSRRYCIRRLWFHLIALCFRLFSLDESHREWAHSEDNFLLLTQRRKIKN